MNILSLFDGISAGYVALERAGIKIDNYYAAEIDKYAIQVSQKNYPNIIQLGNVYDIDYSKLPKIDIVIGGSPCTQWSIAKKDRETTSEGIGFDLFMQFVKGVRETNCKYFLYENNHSIHKNIKEAITKELGVDFIMINSALLSAQQRKRCYWTNIPNVNQPNDKNISLKDVLETGSVDRNKSYCIDACYYKGANLEQYLRKSRRQLVAEPVCGAYRGRYLIDGKRQDYKMKTAGLTTQRLEIRNDDKTNTLTTVQKDNVIIEPVRLGQIGKGGQGDRIYSINGKSVCLSANGGGRGAKTGLYKIDLPDGEYVVRKLTPLECERLQTFNDNFTDGISNTRRYRCLGNSWTVDVITHIFNYIPK